MPFSFNNQRLGDSFVGFIPAIDVFTLAFKRLSRKGCTLGHVGLKFFEQVEDSQVTHGSPLGPLTNTQDV